MSKNSTHLSSGVSLVFGCRQYMLQTPILSRDRKNAAIGYYRPENRACALPDKRQAHATQPTPMATVKHIVAIFIHIVASELILQLRFWHEFLYAYSLPRYASQIRLTATICC